MEKGTVKWFNNGLTMKKVLALSQLKAKTISSYISVLSKTKASNH